MSTAAEVAASLLAAGHVEVEEFGELRIGTRVRLSGQRWWEACEFGTGAVERIFHKPNSSWERSYGRPDVELIVKRDKPSWGPEDTHAFVADYHVAKAYEQVG